MCTMRDNASSLDSFICYNLALGFSALLLYADDPEDEVVVVARRYPADRVLLRTHDATLHEEWRRLPSWGRLQLYAATEVQARQMLNAEHAMQRSLALGLDFLLHVDSDELLHLPCATGGGGGGGGEALQAHAALLSQRGALQFTYRNLEAVPEQEVRTMRTAVAAPVPVASVGTATGRFMHMHVHVAGVRRPLPAGEPLQAAPGGARAQAEIGTPLRRHRSLGACRGRGWATLPFLHQR